ncbi:MAG: hypothetical protein KGS61_14400 [Verrucomicrobia bacterium]|nr:hypothetical protein [Verrucomicrobiota bacterium]
MSTTTEIEDVIRRLPPAEAPAIAKWLGEYLVREVRPPTPPTEDAVAKWRGRQRLPVGGDVDDYLRLTRDGHNR